MPRYYESENLVKFIKQHTPHINGETTLACVERAIREAPTAEVAPRAELAREIFEALERTPMFADYDTDGERILCFYAQEYDELKKKYTEANHETRN